MDRNNIWPSMRDWEATLPERGPERLIAHTRLYHQFNRRLKAVHAADAKLGKFPECGDELGAATRAELAGIFVRLRKRCTRSK